MQKFKNVPTLSGLVSFSPTAAHGVRAAYRVIRVPEQHAEGRRAPIKAKVVPKI